MASSGSDQFFEEEEDLARQQASPVKDGGKAKSKVKAQVQTQKTATGHKPPSFALAVLIAVVALLLGVGIGYFAAMAVVDRSDGAAGSTTPAASAVLGSSEEGSLPSGHPDIASMMNPDGSVNQEALDAYKASRASQQSSEGVQQAE